MVSARLAPGGHPRDPASVMAWFDHVLANPWRVSERPRDWFTDEQWVWADLMSAARQMPFHPAIATFAIHRPHDGDTLILRRRGRSVASLTRNNGLLDEDRAAFRAEALAALRSAVEKFAALPARERVRRRLANAGVRVDVTAKAHSYLLPPHRWVLADRIDFEDVDTLLAHEHPGSLATAMAGIPRRAMRPFEPRCDEPDLVDQLIEVLRVAPAHDLVRTYVSRSPNPAASFVGWPEIRRFADPDSGRDLAVLFEWGWPSPRPRVGYDLTYAHPVPVPRALAAQVSDALRERRAIPSPDLSKGGSRPPTPTVRERGMWSRLRLWFKR